MTLTEIDDRTPEQIERDIVTRRASLKGKLNALEHRLSPGEQMHEMRQRLNPEAIAPWAAVGAIATGAVLAMRGLRRHRTPSSDDDILIDDGVLVDDDILDETVCVDIAVPPGVVP